MILKMKNNPTIEYFEGSVNEYHEIKDELFPEWIDIAEIPAELGIDVPERINTWLKYKKDGLYIFDSAKA